MSRVRFYSGEFRPGVDSPVKPGLSLSPQDFGRLSLDAQQSVIAQGSKYGDPGVADPSWSVPPMCRRGVALSDLTEILESSDARIRAGINRKISHDAFEKRVSSLAKDNSLMLDGHGD